MSTKMYHVIGVMSGTSRDGIDLAYVELIYEDRKWSFKILKANTLSYTQKWYDNLGKADTFSRDKLFKLNQDYTLYLSDKILQFIANNKIEKIDAICSHGHTILHQPEKGLTLQIGNLPQLSELVHQKVVCDFRTQDVKLGGQGAPLVPIGDQLLFSDYEACINLGGFANISMENKGKRIAYDICPVNTVLNFYAEKCGKKYDDKGKIAKSGLVNETLLNQLNALKFYTQNPPKSLGIEWVKTVIFPLLESQNESPKNILATFTHHVVEQLIKSTSNIKKGKVLITGGGAYNVYLIDLLRLKSKYQIDIPNPLLIDYKEALIFGLLGVLKLRNEINVLSSVTGAKEDHSSGEIYS